MRIIFAILVATLISGCDPVAKPVEPGGRYSTFEVKEYGVVCVSGGSKQLSCVKL